MLLPAGEDEEEGAGQDPEGVNPDGIPPTFTEKPRIIPNETGTVVTMKFRVSAERPFSRDLCYELGARLESKVASNVTSWARNYLLTSRLTRDMTHN